MRETAAWSNTVPSLFSPGKSYICWWWWLNLMDRRGSTLVVPSSNQQRQLCPPGWAPSPARPGGTTTPVTLLPICPCTCREYPHTPPGGKTSAALSVLVSFWDGRWGWATALHPHWHRTGNGNMQGLCLKPWDSEPGFERIKWLILTENSGNSEYKHFLKCQPSFSRHQNKILRLKKITFLVK